MTSFKYQSLTESIYQQIKEEITKNIYKPGDRLQEQQIAETLGVSRTPVREALSRLVLEKWVKKHSRRGYFVSNPSNQDIKDMYEAREALEALAVELMMPKISDEDIAELENIFLDFNEALINHDLPERFKQDRKFHDQLIKLSGNNVLVDLYNQLGGIIQRTRWIRRGDNNLLKITQREHEELLKALIDRDEKLAVKLTRSHIKRVKEDLLKMPELNHELETA